MYQYKVVKLKLRGILMSDASYANQIEEEMNKQAKEGWRVHKLNTEYTPIISVLIIFEKEV